MTDPSRPSFNPLARRSWTDLGPRLASAIVLLVVATVGIYFGGYIFAVLVGAVFAGCYREWDRMVTLKRLDPAGGALIGLLALSALVYPVLGPLSSLGVIAVAALIGLVFGGQPRAWRVAGIVFYGIVVVAILAIRGEASGMLSGIVDIGFWALLFLGVVIWMTDTGAYFTGRQVGGERLAPGISPSKTWSGAIGGLALGTLAGLVLWLLIAPQSPWWIGLLLAGAMSIIGQVGDLTESAIKRRFRVKDSGDIIPGHGGLMDRMDSLTFGALFLFLVGFAHRGYDAIAAGFLNW